METDAGCPVGILIDLSEPTPCEIDNTPEDNKENSAPLIDEIEVTRTDNQQDCKLDIENSLKHEMVEKPKSLQSQNSASDVRLIDEEVFDFDLPASPDSGREEGGEPGRNTVDDEEVFFGPVGFTEKCIAAGVAEVTVQPLSPLRPDQVAELAKEAYSVACRIAMMNTGEGSVNSTSDSPTKPLKPPSFSVRRKLISVDIGDNDSGGEGPSLQNKEPDDKDSEGVSPRKRRRSGSFSKEGSPDSVFNAAAAAAVEKGRERRGTFTKEELVESVAVSSRTTRSMEKEQRAKAVPVSGIAQPGRQGARRLQPPSKLRRYNNSQPNLLKPKGATEEGGEEQAHSEGSSVGTIPPVAKRSLQLPRAAGAGNSKRPRRGNDGENGGDCVVPDEGRPPNAIHPTRPGVRRAQSLNVKSGLPSSRASKLALPSGKSSAAAAFHGQKGEGGGGEAPPASSSSSNSRKSTGIPKGPTTKPQLMQPGQLQRKSFAMGRGRNSGAGASSTTGPMKAKPNLGDTVERPHNPALAAAAAGNSQCPSTPAGQRSLPPRVLSDASTPAKSSSSTSSVCGSTPGSVNKRMSMLPMSSSKRRSGASSLPPPSPMSLGSSCSSVSKRSLASSSDAADSPVFDPRASSRLARSRRASGAKPRKPLVQNTPELPKRTLSRWSPLRKPKAVPLEDQVSLCTKRVPPK
ncbi:uncharacterized protein LOC143285237 isoform X2 [Babylonia areolata]|uniref:uncharacterized protein LOC143285237 isoform X2 n=1 Tax=Babylonia areolata TaxID=304850 RepID=UPI003FD07376